jgi:hypothetical protein
MFVMQPNSIELLYVNAQPLYKINIIKREPKEGYAIGACLAHGKEGLSQGSFV